MYTQNIPYEQRIKLFCEEDKTTGCWQWIRARHKAGYGAIGWTIRGKIVRYAHRASYELFVGPIPDDVLVCHRCDNRLCINPQHLFLGTWKDNYDDMVQKGRGITGRKRPRISASLIGNKRGKGNKGRKMTPEQCAKVSAGCRLAAKKKKQRKEAVALQTTLSKGENSGERE